MEARRQRIADMVRELLPCVQTCQRQKRTTHIIILISLGLYMMLGVHLVADWARPINTNEYAILNNVIHLTAQERGTTPAIITQKLQEHFNIKHLQDLYARHWHNALHFLAEDKKLE